MKEIISEYAVHLITISKSIKKYQEKYRDTTVYSDTDSIFAVIEKYVNKFRKTLNLSNSKEMNFKIVNTMSYLISKYFVDLHYNILKDCNVQIDKKDMRLNAKNEIYYETVFFFKNAKKNYAGLRLLREGNILPEAKQLTYTGLKLTASKIHPFISELRDDILMNDILRSDKMNLANILKKIEIGRLYIINAINDGDKSFGIINRFSGLDYYSNKTNSNCRTADAWNRIYPLDSLLPGDYMYTFETTLFTIEDAEKIIDPNIKKIVKETIFSKYYNGEDNYLRPYGLRLFSVPRDGNMLKLPEWIIPFIAADSMARKHLRPISDMLPSLGGKLTKVGTNINYSSLLQF